MVDEYLTRDGGRVGAMIRHMTGDVGESFQRTLQELYKNENGKVTHIGQICCKWHWILVKYSVNPYESRRFVSVIQTAYRRNINLDKLPQWKEMLRIILPEEFLTKMNNFTTQVPKIAIMDDTHTRAEKKTTRSSSEVLW